MLNTGTGTNFERGAPDIPNKKDVGFIKKHLTGKRSLKRKKVYRIRDRRRAEETRKTKNQKG